MGRLDVLVSGRVVGQELYLQCAAGRGRDAQFPVPAPGRVAKIDCGVAMPHRLLRTHGRVSWRGHAPRFIV